MTLKSCSVFILNSFFHSEADSRVFRIKNERTLMQIQNGNDHKLFSHNVNLLFHMGYF